MFRSNQRSLRRAVAAAFAETLTRQDSQTFRPHVTFQNKADPALARSTLRELERTFRPFACEVTGLDVWFWRGGPWEAAGSVTLDG